MAPVKKTKYLILILLGLSAFTVNRFLVREIQHRQNFQKSAHSQNEFLVTRVIDGDTIEIETGERVRYIGIDAPDKCFALEAKRENEKLVLGEKVRLEKDVSETDSYGRLLRYVWRENNLINLELVKNGFAKTTIFPPDIKYQEFLITAQEQAREKNLGLWDKCRK